VLVEMDLDENTGTSVRNSPRVTGFVGSANRAAALFPKAEVDAIINRVHTPQVVKRRWFTNAKGSAHVDGPFANFKRPRSEEIARPQPPKGIRHDFRALHPG